ncbi:MAG: alpha-mannosidase [Fimbriimonas sp.]
MLLPPIPQTPAPKPTLYIATYSHLDTEWCWTYRQSILEYIPNTLRDNFAVFERHPNYVFNWTGAARYRFMKEYYPGDYARLKGYVAAGRWVPTGSAWDENDAIVPSPESIIRSIHYANRFFREEFGVTSRQYMMPDTFGFPASLPTVLAHCGIHGFSTKKLTYGAGAAVGVPFNLGRWIGPDGQGVYAALNPGDYRQRVTEDLSQSKAWRDRIEENGRRSGVYTDYMYHGNGDEGGSPGLESAAWLERSLAGKGPVRIVAGDAEEIFTRLAAERPANLPTYQGDLLLIQHSAGSINSGAAMKRWNHRNELMADAAERIAVAADLRHGGTYPGDRLREGWLRFLLGQMHDILPGTSIPAAYEFAWNDQVIAMNTFADVTQTAVSRLASEMDTRGAGIPLVVYNPLAVEREETVEAELTNAPAHPIVFDAQGRSVPTQILRREGGKTKIAFQARVPSVGLATFHVRQSSPSGSELRVSSREIENGRYRVRLDDAGDVASVYDKRARREMLSAPARLAFLYEKPERHPAWNMEWTDRQKAPVGYVDGPAKISIAENGPARVALRVERAARGSKFVQVIRLSKGGDRVEFLQEIDWRTAESSLKAVFPLTVSNLLATYNWQVGTIQRGNNDPKKYEVPTHRWIDLTAPDGRYGVSVLNEAKYGSDKPSDDTLRLTLLYTPGVRDNYQHQATQDWGRHEIRYALMGHAGDWRRGDTQNQAARFNQPLLAFQTSPHPGRLGKRYSLVSVDRPGVMVAALKKAEDSDAVIVRLFENEGRAVKGARLRFAMPVQDVREVDGQEAPVVSGLALKARGNEVEFDMAAYRPRAFALRFRRPASPPGEAIALKLPFDRDVASSGTGLADGAFDASGRSLPGELLPARLTSGGVPFTLGSVAGSDLNAVAAEGQTLALPPSKGARRLSLLAAAEADVASTLRIGGRTVPWFVQAWDGFIGQWDNRIWKGEVPLKTFAWKNELAGIAPAFIKRAPLAWYADHHRLPSGTNDPYRFAYLYRYDFEVPAEVSTITLPGDPRIKVLGATVTRAEPLAIPTEPLYERGMGGPPKF